MVQQGYIADRLAEYGCKLRFDDLPRKVVEAVKERILDTIGVSLLGAKAPWSRAVYEVVRNQGGARQATILGYGGKSSVSSAAFANGAFCHANDFDDGYAHAPFHPAGTAVWTALPLAEYLGLDGKGVITSIVYGAEVAVRIAEAGWSGPAQERAFGKRGFQAQAVCGTLGAAAQAAVVLGLPQDKVASAIGIAGSYAGGLLEFLTEGTDTKRFLFGKAAQQGIVSALLARSDFRGPHSVIEGEKGFLHAYAEGHVAERALENLGHTFNILNSKLKKWPTMGGNDTAIEAFAHIVQTHGLPPTEIKTVDVRMRTHYVAYSRPQVPASRFVAEMSLPFAIGALAMKGALDFYVFDEFNDPGILAFAKKVFVHPSPEIDRLSRIGAASKSVVTVKTKDGREFTHSKDYPDGDPRSPLPAAVVEKKFLSNCTLSVGEAIGKKLLPMIRSFDEADPGSLKKFWRTLGKRFLQ